MRALALYRELPVSVRFHTRVRAWTCPFEPIVARLPGSGRLLEVGCGHGLFANEAALRRPELAVLGVDPAPAKIGWAQRTTGDGRNVAFRCQRLEDVAESGFDAVAVLDVLYLVPRASWPAFLSACRDRLRRGGVLLLKEVDTRPRFKFWRCVLQETLSVRLLGITLGASFAFASRAEVATVLGEVGFGTPVVTDLGRGYLTPHVLYEARRP